MQVATTYVLTTRLHQRGQSGHAYTANAYEMEVGHGQDLATLIC